MTENYEIRSYKELAERQISSAGSLSDLREFIFRESLIPEEFHQAIFDACCLPQVAVTWNSVPRPGTNCVPKVEVIPSRFYHDVAPQLHISPPQTMRSFFSDSHYSLAASELRPNYLAIDLQQDTSAGRTVWYGVFPFHVPSQITDLSGEHHFQVAVDFPRLWQRTHRFFKGQFQIEVAAVRANGPRKLKIKGSAANINADLRDYDEVEMDVSGPANVQQVLSELLEEPNSKAGHFKHSVVLQWDGILDRRLPQVDRIASAAAVVTCSRGMLCFSNSNRRLYFYGESPKLRFGRHTDRADVVVRFTPSGRGSDETCPIRLRNREASRSISNDHCELELTGQGLLVRNLGSRELNVPAATLINGRSMKRFGETQSMPANHRTLQLELGGCDIQVPRFEMKVTAVSSWDDDLSNGIQPAEDLAHVCGDRRQGWRLSNENRIDAVVVSHGKPDYQAEATHVLLARQIFLDNSGHVVEDPGHSRRTLAARLIYAGSSFFIQSVNANLQLLVGNHLFKQYEVVPLTPGMNLQFRFNFGQSLSADWDDAVYITK